MTDLNDYRSFHNLYNGITSINILQIHKPVSNPRNWILVVTQNPSYDPYKMMQDLTKMIAYFGIK